VALAVRTLVWGFDLAVDGRLCRGGTVLAEGDVDIVAERLVVLGRGVLRGVTEPIADTHGRHLQ
jgi:hypothetical protein